MDRGLDPARLPSLVPPTFPGQPAHLQPSRLYPPWYAPVPPLPPLQAPTAAALGWHFLTIPVWCGIAHYCVKFLFWAEGNICVCVYYIQYIPPTNKGISQNGTGIVGGNGMKFFCDDVLFGSVILMPVQSYSLYFRGKRQQTVNRPLQFLEHFMRDDGAKSASFPFPSNENYWRRFRTVIKE